MHVPAMQQPLRQRWSVQDRIGFKKCLAGSAGPARVSMLNSMQQAKQQVLSTLTGLCCKWHEPAKPFVEHCLFVPKGTKSMHQQGTTICRKRAGKGKHATQSMRQPCCCKWLKPWAPICACNNGTHFRPSLGEKILYKKGTCMAPQE